MDNQLATVQEINELVRQESAFVQDFSAEIRKVIVGQNRLIERLMLALLADGHILIEGVPGLAKTLSVTTLAGMLQASFQRIQFTPDLLPSDITGTEIYQPESKEKQGWYSTPDRCQSTVIGGAGM